MLVFDISNVDKKKYKKIIEYFLKRCDKITFQFPGVDKDGCVLPDDFWQDYHNKTKQFLQSCYRYSGKKEYSRNYQGMKLGWYGIVVSVKPFPLLVEMLYKNHLFDWLAQNGLPEDVCFHRNNSLWLFTCSHEEEIYMVKEDEQDIRFLTLNSITYRRIKD